MDMTTSTLIREADAAARPRRAHRALRDARGCPVSTASPAALAHAEKAQWRLLSYFGDALADLDAAIEEDPSWMLPHVMKANALLSLTEHGFAVDAVDSLRRAGELAQAGHANERERRHLAATRLCAAGRWREACAAWEALLVDHPQDLVALGIAHLFDFNQGDSRSLHRRVARVLPEWSPSAPLYSFVLGMYAFGLEENNLYARAQEAALAALEIDRRDPWAVHAVAHVHEMQGQHVEGTAWLESRTADWAPDNGLAFHNWWHLALFHLERRDTGAALALLDERIAPGAQMALQRLDVTAMMWRLQLMGVDLGDRWRQLAGDWPAQAPGAGYYAFNDLHALLTHLGAGRLDLARRVVAAAEQPDRDALPSGGMACEVGAPLLRGLLAYGEGRFDEATETLSVLRGRWFGLGGSHAQRDLLEQTLLDAAIRGGQRRLARHLLNERLLAKPRSPLTEYWTERVGCATA